MTDANHMTDYGGGAAEYADECAAMSGVPRGCNDSRTCQCVRCAECPRCECSVRECMCAPSVAGIRRVL